MLTEYSSCCSGKIWEVQFITGDCHTIIKSPIIRARKQVYSMKQLLSLIVLLLLSSSIGLGQNDYDQKWNLPTISHKSFNPYFGMLGVYERNTTSDKKEMPAIPGLKYRSCMVVCPIDSCFGQRALIAIRCPDNAVLLDAISGRLCDYSNKITHSTAIRKCENPESSATVRSYYIDAIRSYLSKNTEHTEG